MDEENQNALGCRMPRDATVDEVIGAKPAAMNWPIAYAARGRTIPPAAPPPRRRFRLHRPAQCAIMGDMSRFGCLLIAGCLLACALCAGGAVELFRQPREEMLTLFDGTSTAGWVVDGDAEVKDGALVFGGDRMTRVRIATDFDPVCLLHLEYSTETAKPIQFEWHHEQFLGGGSHSISLARLSSKPGEWIEAVFEGKQQPGGVEWANSCKWRVVGDPAFAEQQQGGSMTMPRSAFVGFAIPAGQRLHLRNVHATTTIVPSWPWLLVLAAIALAGLIAATALARLLMRNRQ